MKFTAIYVEATTNSIANVMFADPETNPDEPSVLLFSRDVESPDSAYYFEVNDQSYSSYGGLTQVRLSRDSLEARLEHSLVQEFGDESFAQVQVEFDLDDATYQSVLETLRNIFALDNILIEE